MRKDNFMSKLVHITTMLAGFFCLCVLFFTVSIYDVEKPVIVEKVEEKPQKMAKKQPIFIENGLFFGTPEGTRTPDLLVRSQSLYPAELPAHTFLMLK